MNLHELSEELMLARGYYATVRSAHEDSKARMAMLCGSLSALASQTLRAAQPDNDAVPDFEAIEALTEQARGAVQRMLEEGATVTTLARQRVEWKTKAWPKTQK